MADRPVAEFRTVVEWIDTDAAGIYHNSTVTRFVEAAEARMMAGPHLDEYFHAAPRVRDLDNWMPIAGTIELTGELGPDGASVRTAISRPKKRGWPDAENRHGVRGYRHNLSRDSSG